MAGESPKYMIGGFVKSPVFPYFDEVFTCLRRCYWALFPGILVSCSL